MKDTNKMPVYRFALLLCAILAGFPARDASAFSVLNLSEQPWQLEVDPSPGDPYQVTVPAKQKVNFSKMPAQIRLLDPTNRRGQLHARDFDEYVIWPNGDFGIQKRRSPKGIAYD